MRRLALIAALVVLIVLAVRLWPDRTDDVTPAPAAPAASTSPAPRPTTTASNAPSTTASATSTGPYGGTDEARRAWEPVVQGFALAYPDTSGLTRKQWLANLRPYLDRTVVDALATTDLEKVPGGRYAGYQLLKVADETVTVRVTFQEGWALVLYLGAIGDGRWLVQALDAALDFD